MLAFLGLCLLSRLAYSLNDIFTGRLARRFGRLEVAAMRGVALGLTMAPLLFWVRAAAWRALGAQWPTLLLVFVLTAASNLLQNHAARLLPFGLRAAFMITGIATTALMLGWLVVGETLAWPQIALAVLLIASAVVAAPGQHAAHEIQPDIRRGAVYALAAALLMGWIALLVRGLSHTTHPFLTAWAWEFGSGLILVPVLVWQYRREPAPGHPRRWARIMLASSPTVVGSGASMLALTLGPLGLWAALGGTQVLFTALFGAWWHRETVGWRRWGCFGVAALAVAGLAQFRG
jgi:drug/metabolite transporter (DMT)-like permease